VLSVGDGIARVYGLDNVQAGEMVEFENGVRGMALNLETDKRRHCDFRGRTARLRKARPSSARARSWTCQSARVCLAAWWTRSATRSMARVRFRRPSAKRVDVKAPGIIPAQVGARADGNGAEGDRRADSRSARGQRELIIGDRQTGKTAIAPRHHS